METFAQLEASHQATPTSFDTLDANMLFKSDEKAQERALDHLLFVKFYRRSLINEAASIAANRAIHEEKVFINIKIPGDKHNDVNRVAFPEDFQRFPKHYAKFKEGQQQIIGTPLNVLPFLNQAQVDDYAYLNVRTVEQLANLADANVQAVMGASQHKQQASEWLLKLNGAEAVRTELQAKLDKQAELMADMAKQLADLQKAKKAA